MQRSPVYLTTVNIFRIPVRDAYTAVEVCDKDIQRQKNVSIYEYRLILIVHILHIGLHKVVASTQGFLCFIMPIPCTNC